jgi:1-aminocyclopropane-1-carboxylate deaminase/D-cysteine desulfhydrase-like pyridoxal-dependent ACC family enzyme
LDCTLVLSLPEATPIPQVYTGNTLLDALMGAQIVWAQPGTREAVFDETFERLWAEGKRPYRIPYGGSNAVGAAGYALAMQELLEQLKSSGHAQPDWIVFASSSGGTQAGLAAGQRLFGYPGKVLGVSVDEPRAKLQTKAAGLAGEVCDLFGAPQRFEPSEILVEDRWIGPGYGVMTELEQQAVKLFARMEGLLLDPVYTGRAAGGMLRLIAEGVIPQRSRVLFWHTGGAPALFAERYKALGA